MTAVPSPECKMKDPHGRNITVVTVFGVLIHQSRVLMIRRAYQPYKGLCTVPGGHKRHGESLKEACLREMLEKTGLKMIDPRLIGLMEVESEGDPRDFMSFYFTCERCEGHLTSSSEGELFWADIGTASDLPEVHPAFLALAPHFLNPGRLFLARALVDSSGRGQYFVGDMSGKPVFS